MRASSADAPRVLAVHPRAGTWPANLLRFHVVFDRPMDRDRALDHVWLEDAAGARLAGALVDMPDGLWSADQTVLTVLLHPGRVKRGLLARTRLGATLAVGRRHAVVVSAAMESAEGVALGQDQRMPFHVGPAIRDALAPGGWFVPRPSPGTREPILVETGRLLDALGAARGLRLRDDWNAPVSATIDVLDTTVRFTPRHPWPDTALTMVVDGDVEDVAGNRAAHSFERNAPPSGSLPWAS